jgi:hypothetical protein
MYVTSKILSDGVSLSLRDEDYRLTYSKRFWKRYTHDLKDTFMNHLSFLSTLHLPLLLKESEIKYNSGRPRFHRLFKKLMMLNIPYFADNDCVPAEKYFKLFRGSRFIFEDDSNGLPEYDAETDGSCIIGFTFGKESLLLYGLCGELGIKNHLVYFEEDDPFGYYENKHKRSLAKEFSGRHAPLTFIKNSLSLLRYYEHFNVPETQVGWTRLLTEYALMSLPLAHTLGSEYLLFGNEKSCDDHYTSKEGYACNPSFDQSSMWTGALDRLTRGLTEDTVSTVSPVQPLHELAIIRILHQRYPELGRYQMSCFTDDDYGRVDRWCHHCTKCARNYVMLLAACVEPADVGFTKNMMTKPYTEYYSLFPEKTTAHTVYDVSGLGRDEQLLSFLLAYENNARGALIDRFKRGFLREARSREDELRKKYLRVHRDRLPNAFSEAKGIYWEELSKEIPKLN